MLTNPYEGQAHSGVIHVRQDLTPYLRMAWNQPVAQTVVKLQRPPASASQALGSQA